MQHELHPARFIEESLRDYRFCGWENAECGHARAHIRGGLFRAGFVESAAVPQRIRVRVPDQPGALARLLAALANADASVLEVEHVRTDPKLSLDEVELALQLETRGAEHSEELLARLRGAGYRIHLP